MASEHSFDIVSKVDMQELDNAVRQAMREIETRFDFKGQKARFAWKNKKWSSLRMTITN